MPRWPNRSSGRPMPLIIAPWFDPEYVNVQSASGASVGWFGANTAIYLPVRFTERVTITKLWWQNGTTATGNVDCGIYNVDGVRLVSTGSTGQSGTSAVQSVDITDTDIPEGMNYLALVASSTSSTFWMPGAGNDPGGYGFSGYVQTSALPLPTTASFASALGGMRFPKFGALRAPRTVV